MALPVTITGIATDVACVGPFKSSGGNFYFFGKDSTNNWLINAQKSTAPDTSWSSVATKDATTTKQIRHLSGYQVSDVIHLLITAVDTTGGASNTRVDYVQFDMSANTFGTAENVQASTNTITSGSAAANGNSVVVRSDGHVVALFQGARASVMGSSWSRIVAKRRTGTNTWVAADGVNNPTPLDAGGSVDFVTPECLLGSSDRTHFFWMAVGVATVNQRALTSANALQTASTAAGGLSDARFLQGVSYDASGTQKIAVLGDDGTNFGTVYFDSGDTPALSVGTEYAGTEPQRLFNDGTDVWALYRKSADSDLYVQKSTDHGATFSGETSALTATIAAANANLSIDGNIFTRGTSVVIPYVINDGGTVKYNEYVVRTTAASGDTVGSASGTGAATGASAATKTADGSAAGTGTASGASGASKTTVGSASGTGTASGAGLAIVQAVGTAAGTGAASATSVASAVSVGSASGIGAASGVSAATKEAAGTAAGTSTAAAVGASLAEAVGTASGTSSADAVGEDASTGTSDTVGTADGIGSATGVGAATKEAAGSADGLGTASAVGAAANDTVGSAVGIGAASAAGIKTAASVGTAAGSSTAAAVGVSVNASVGTAAGTGTATGAGASLAEAVGSAAGSGSASAIADTGVAIGVAVGVGSADAVGASLVEAVGIATGTSTAAAVSQTSALETPVEFIGDGIDYAKHERSREEREHKERSRRDDLTEIVKQAFHRVTADPVPTKPVLPKIEKKIAKAALAEIKLSGLGDIELSLWEATRLVREYENSILAQRQANDDEAIALLLLAS